MVEAPDEVTIIFALASRPYDSQCWSAISILGRCVCKMLADCDRYAENGELPTVLELAIARVAALVAAAPETDNNAIEVEICAILPGKNVNAAIVGIQKPGNLPQGIACG